jgi:hypothetical protein
LILISISFVVSMGSRVAIDRVEPHAGRRSRNLHHELSSFHSRSQSSADANANGRGAGNLKSPIASTDAPTPPPLFLVHRIGDDTSSNISTLDLSPILHRRLTTAQDTVQLARDEEALVEKWLGDGHGWIGMNAGEDDLLSANGKVKKKRNVNRNWSPCVGCREKKVKVSSADREMKGGSYAYSFALHIMILPYRLRLLSYPFTVRFLSSAYAVVRSRSKGHSVSSTPSFLVTFN